MGTGAGPEIAWVEGARVQITGLEEFELFAHNMVCLHKGQLIVFDDMFAVTESRTGVSLVQGVQGSIDKALNEVVEFVNEHGPWVIAQHLHAFLVNKGPIT